MVTLFIQIGIIQLYPPKCKCYLCTDPYFSKYRKEDGTPLIENVSVGGESGPDARPCDFAWVLDSHVQCVENGVSFSYHQTGARLIKGGKVFDIPREAQHSQAHKAKLDFNGTSLIGMPGE